MSSIFDRHYKKYDSWYVKNEFAYLSEAEALKKVIPPTGKGLEIGVGTGRFASCLGIKYGIDPSGNMLKIAQKRGIDVRQGRGEKLPFASSTFDYVAIIITLCFVKDPYKVLREARRVLKKGGKIIIGIIDKNSFLGRFYQSKNSIFYKQANFFGIRGLTNLLKETGFNRIYYHQAIFKFPDKINSIENTRTGYGKGGFVAIGARKAFRNEARN
jgi:ubiquinone/menaquinone biosynthesis C-methylase UbiE